jgi:hypothetical protein
MPAIRPSALRDSVTLAGCVAITEPFGVVVADGLGVIDDAIAALLGEDMDADGVGVAPVDGITAGVGDADDVGVAAAVVVAEPEWLGTADVRDAAGLGFAMGVGE